MKAESYRDITLLCLLYTEGHITAEEYYAAIDAFSTKVIEKEVKEQTKKI